MAKTALRVAEANQAQADAWDGDEGAYWAKEANFFDRSVAVYHDRLMDAAEIQRPDRVLDIGCGTGQTTRDAARRAASGRAVGVDLSARMLEVARQRARDEGVENVAFEQADAQSHPFDPSSFDVALSRTGAMFFADPTAAFDNIGRALEPGGRLALLTWQPLSENEWLQAFATALAAGRDVPKPPPNVPGPFALSEPDHVRGVLTHAGFVDVELEPLNERMWFGTDADEAYRLILGLLGWMLRDADDETRRRGEEALRQVMTEHETPDGVLLGSGAWIITGRRAAQTS